jgi:hypothetical protein
MTCFSNVKPLAWWFFYAYKFSTAYPNLMHSPLFCGQLWDNWWKTLDVVLYHRLWFVVVQTQYMVVHSGSGEFFS